MQEQEKLREIESLGEEAEDFQEDAMWEESRREAGSWGGILLVQAVICALIVLALIFFKVSDDGKYQ